MGFLQRLNNQNLAKKAKFRRKNSFPNTLPLDTNGSAIEA
ncbi:hypothetical protein HMPREF0645_0563 [Hallella bergensis DSM 17361]|uniref:Uncharacterized protein n=1 Tax=Hallella bergensis DSM 17361 TaxID=585502 RepID=D1PUC8_9BACT|nr:hypothetical protein HMPREF0645_0563 [Hallella bergensis DSM 17361]